MFNKCATSKCTSRHASNEKKQIAEFYFPLKYAELNKQWIRFLNRRHCLAAKSSVLRKLLFEEKSLKIGFF